MDNKTIAVIGAGITGLVSALELQNNGYKATIFERRSEPGGSIKTVKNNDWQIEYGPNTLLLKDRDVSEFIDRIGLSGDKVIANPIAAKRFIVKNGVLEPLPSSFLSALTTPLFSLKAKLRVLLELFIPKSKNRDQTIEEFVRRRLGREILDYAINPFVAGIYANKPENLSLRHTLPMMDNLEQSHGSLIWGSIAGAKERAKAGRIPRQLISFTGGLQQLTNTIASQLDHINLNHDVTKIEKNSNGWMVHTQMGVFGPYSNIVVNVPMHKWNSHIMPIQKSQLEVIKKTTYPPLSVLLLGYKKEDVVHPLDGFGFLVPEKEKKDILGALFSSTLFEGRAPEDCHLLTVFVGGGRQPELAAMDSEQMINMVEHELKELIGLKGEAVFKDHIYWPDSIPGYHVGYDEVLTTLKTIEKENEGLHLAGNFRGGVSVPDCIKNGLALASKIADKNG